MAGKKGADALVELKKQIKENNLKNIYLFYGEETYLKELYIKRIEELVPDGGFPEFNRIFLNGVRPFSEYDDAWESFPMMSDKRLIIIKDSNIMKARTKDDGGEKVSSEDKKAFWSEKFKHISDDTIVIFNETSADKRSSLYKTLVKIGFAVEFKYMTDTERVSYVMKNCLKHRKKINKDTAEYLVSIVDPGLDSLNNELNKLFDFCGEEIYITDVKRVVSKSLQVITFDLTDAIINGDTQKAVSVLSDIKSNTKSSSFAILYLMLASFEKILHTKLLTGKSQYEIASAISSPPFIANKYIESAKRFSVENLTRMVTRVAEIDLEIKEGKTDEWTALYTYVTECLNMMQ